MYKKVGIAQYKKALYNIMKIKKMWGGGGAIFEPKHSQCI